MVKEEVMDVTVVCRSFPQTSLPQVYRENILDTIDTIFEGDTHLLVIEGAEGTGKTTLLTQFARNYSQQTFSLFIKPTSRWTYDPHFLLLDLCCQLIWVLDREELHDLNHIDDGFLRNCLFRLQRLARRKHYYFIIDGLEDISDEEPQVRKAIFEMLPFGFEGFRFLLSGDLHHLFDFIPKDVYTKSFPLAKFTLDETTQYLKDITDDRGAIEEIYRTCRGMPGALASIRRIVHAGAELQQLLVDLPSKLPQLFDIEWRTIKENDEQVHLLLAILAHSLKRHTLEDLARISHLPYEQVREHLQGIGFVVITPQQYEVNFVSESFRKFAADRLEYLKEQVNTYLIEDLMSTPDTDDSLTYLPGYLVQAGRFEDLLTYLSPDDHFTKIVEYNQSLSPVRQRADLGIRTALQLNRNEDLMRFCIQRATIDDFDRAEVWRSEVEARMALHDYNAALALAQGTQFKEDRLHLLAVIAKAKREQGLLLEPELLEQIRHLYMQIDHATLGGERALDIASDLIYSLPDLAIELVEKTTFTDTDSSARDWAFAKLSLATFKIDPEAFQLTDALENIQSRIENPVARRLSHATNFLFQNSSAQEVIAEVAAFEVIDRLNLLRLWATVNRTQKDAIEVVDAALKLMIQTTDYMPNARVLRELASPLPYAAVSPKVRQLVGTLDGQKDVIEDFGPTEDYVRLQLLLARTESNYEDHFETVRSRFIECYFYICDIDDLAIKAQCLARLADLLATVDPQKTLESRDRIHTAVQDDMQMYIERLLETTADHYHATQGIIRVLAKKYPDKALELATTLNSEPRRDQALVDLLTSTVQAPVKQVDWDFIAEVLQRISDQDFVDDAHLSIVEELIDASTIDELTLSRVIPFLIRVERIRDAEKRCRACALAYILLKKYDIAERFASLATQFLTHLRTAWEVIDEGWNKVNAGFELAKALVDTSHEQAQQSINLTEDFKDTILLEVPTTAATYGYCLALAIRAYSGLLPQNLISKGDRERLTDFIERVPSLSVRAELWAELGLRNYTQHHEEVCKQIVNEHVRPLLNEMRDDNAGKYNVTVPMVAPALYCTHQLTTLEQIAALPQPHRDMAYTQICLFILRKLPPSDPYEILPGYNYQLTYDNVVDLCALLTHMEVDGIIYNLIQCITDSVIAGRQKGRFSRQQQQAIIDRLNQIIQTRLPSPRYIQHDGYVIAARAQVARIQRAKQDVWLTLLANAREIPNLSDKALVLSIIAVSMPRDLAIYKEILEEAGSVIKTIPVHLEKIRKYQNLASLALDIDSSLSKKYIEAAMDCTTRHSDTNVRSAQKNLIDLAYRLDTDFAALLASRMDDDPARDEMKQRLRILEAKKNMQNDALVPSNEGFSVEDYADAAWMSLGALNTGRFSTVRFDHTHQFLQVAANHPLHQTYPIMAWAIENAIKRFSHTDYGKTHLRSIYNATLLSVELTTKMAARSSDQVRRTKDYSGKSPDPSSSIIIHPGEREEALHLLLNWFENEVRGYLVICDAFFGLEDLEVLKLLNAVNRGCKVQILTSRKHQLNQEVRTPWDDAYRDHWLKISDQNPPYTEIVIVGTQKSQGSPVHDRWWLTEGGGLRVGTSFNSLGITKTSEISKLSSEEAKSREGEINQYIQSPRKQEHEGERLLYTAFNL